MTPNRRLPSYAVVSPVRDEGRDIACTAACLVDQTHRPQRWIVVDDGSTDDTKAIAESFAADHEWITVTSTAESHDRGRGGPIVRAFEHGCTLLDERPDIIVKLDGDIFLPAHYFEWVAETFARDERAGVVGGVVLVERRGSWRPESTSHVIGAVKAYRMDCLDDIGGLSTSMGWDTIDEYGARSRGWRVYVLPELTALHLRARGSKQAWYRARWEEGRGDHYMGYSPAFLLVRAAYRALVEPPPILGGLALLLGFLYAWLTSAPQIEDRGAVAALREEQAARLRRLPAGGRAAGTSHPPDGGPVRWAAARARDGARRRR